MPRSGSTLAEQILAAHPLVHGAGERPAMHALMRRLAPGRDMAAMVRTLAALDAATLSAEGRAFLDALHALAPDARHVIDKMPENANHLGFIATLLPGARVILCQRDPRDIGLSIYQLRFFGYHPYAHDLGDLGWYLGQHARLMAHWRAVLPIPLLEVSLSDWVEDFRATLDRVLAFLDLPVRSGLRAASSRSSDSSAPPAPSRCAGRSTRAASAAGGAMQRNWRRCWPSLTRWRPIDPARGRGRA